MNLANLFFVRKNKNMKRYLPFYSIFFCFILITACKGQEKTSPPKEVINKPQQPTLNLLDNDPYFAGTTTITTPYGPKSITRKVLQDSKGNFWLATWDGIICYDGTAFTNFTNKQNLRRYRVFTILEDKMGRIWFGTIGAGVYRYDGKSFTNFTTKEGLVNDSVACLYEDKTGNIWIGTQGGISKYDGQSFQNFTTEDGLTDNDVNSIIEDKNGKFWFGTRGDACFYDGQTFTNFKNKAGKSFQNVRCVIADKNGYIWLGGNDGLWRYHPNEDLASLTNFSTKFVGYIYEDSKGNIWTNSEGEDGGQWVLSRYDAKPLSYELPIATPIRTEQNMFFGIIEDIDSNIWFGTLRGVCRYDGASFDYFRAEEGK